MSVTVTSDDEDGVVGWCSCVCGCDNDNEWMIQHLEIFLVVLPELNTEKGSST